MEQVYRSLLPSVIEISEEAGLAILDVYRSEAIAGDHKSDGSPITEADRAAQRIIASGLTRIAPDIPQSSEEAAAVDYAERSGWPVFWLIDPLDGTKEFLQRSDEFTVNIALIVEGVAHLGVVHAPALHATYWGDANSGAHKHDRSGRRSIRTQPPHAVPKILVSRSHRDEQTNVFLERFGRHEATSVGSSLKFCVIAEGSASLYPRFGPTMEWDVAAGACILEAAGGSVCDLHGQPLRFNKPDLHNPPFVAAWSADWQASADAAPVG